MKLVNAALAAAAMLMLLAPALWNGFPLLEYDTGGYLARWFEGTLEVSRSTVYGFSPGRTRAARSLARHRDAGIAHGVDARAGVAGAWARATAAYSAGHRDILTVATTLPWIVSMALTDIFAGLGVLALYLLTLHAEELTAWEQAALVVLAAFAAASHSATLAVMLLVLVAAGIAAILRPALVPWRRLRAGVAALILAPVLLLTANYAVAGRLAWTPGGFALPFGRLLQDGIVARFLAEHCPDPRFKLCDHRDALPTDADVFFWGESIFDRLGRFEGLDQEMRTIVHESLRAYPGWQIEAAIRAALRQLVTVKTGEGVNDVVWHTYNMIEKFTPAMLPAMRAARQQQGKLDFTTINKLHVPVAVASMLLLVATIVLALMRPRFADLGPLAATVTLAILANAAVCGVLANPHDRYGARMVWLATLVVALVPWRALIREYATTVVLDRPP